jgi:hypothetical protein
MDPVLKAIESEFTTLTSRYGMALKVEEANPPEYRVVYLNDTTGLEVVVDWSELRPFVWLHRLESGRLPVPSESNHLKALQTVDADDVLLLRNVPGNPVGKLLARADLSSLTPCLAGYVRAIGAGCTDILAGDFRIFEEILPIVQNRIRESRS